MENDFTHTVLEQVDEKKEREDVLVLCSLDADRASQVLQRFVLLEKAATEQLNTRRGAEHDLFEAENRIAQLDQALQQGGRRQLARWWMLVFSGDQTCGTAARRRGQMIAS